MLTVQRIQCEELDRRGLLRVCLINSDASEVSVVVTPAELRDFRLVQAAVVKQTGLWLHHPSESGRTEDRLAWKRLVEQAPRGTLERSGN